MTIQTIKHALMALAIGFLVQLGQECLASEFLARFLADNLIALLVALLAINSATMGIVLTKVRDLVDSQGNGTCFASTRKQMIHSVKEQICLIIVGIVFLSFADSKLPVGTPNLPLLLQSCITGVFVYSLFVLYDTAKSVLLIVDFDPSRKDD